jgi:hypothetical protein
MISSWAVLVCKFQEDMSPTLPIEHYKRLFTGDGTGSFNMTDYFSTMSHGNLDLTQSQVFGPFTIPLANKAAYDALGSGARAKLIQIGQQTAAANGIDLTKFAGLVVCMNGPMDIFGALGAMFAAFDSGTWLAPSICGQEMGHGYGLDHSRMDGSTADYKDPWDTMSTWSPYEVPNTEYNDIGPGLNAWNMRSQSWLDESRVWTCDGSGGGTVTTVQLRPLHRRDLSGFLAINIGEYLVEYRKQERWDANIPRSAVFVHRFDDGHSYVMRGTNGNFDLVAGDIFQQGTNEFTGIQKVEVKSIDDSTSTATIAVTCQDRAQPPNATLWGFLLGGVANDGGGWIIVNGRGIRVPPGDPPWVSVLQQIAVFQEARDIGDGGARLAAQRTALRNIEQQLRAIGIELNAFKVPAQRPREG